MTATDNRILCVDDDPFVLTIFRMLHGKQRQTGDAFHIETAENGEQGMAMLKERGPFAVVLSDMNMPGMDGIQLLRCVRESAPNTVRLMMTGHVEIQTAIDAVNEGHIFRFLSKPCSVDLLIKTLVAALRQYRLQVAERDLLEKTVAGSLKVLTDVLSLINPAAFGRAARVRRLVQRIASVLVVEGAWQLEAAATLSQTGCVTVPEDVLRKVYLGQTLDPNEAAVFEAHPKLGRDLIAAVPRLEAVAEIVAYQEKGFDGSGFPADGKRGTDIPLGARILKVALDFDRLESQGFAADKALTQMNHRWECYDPAVLDALTSILETDTRIETKELSVSDLLRLLESAEKAPNGEPLPSMSLAENVLSGSGMMLLSKGQKITLPLLKCLRNFTNRSTVREPIHVRLSGSDSAELQRWITTAAEATC